MGETEAMLTAKIAGLLLFSVGGFGVFAFFVISLRRGFEESVRRRAKESKTHTPTQERGA